MAGLVPAIHVFTLAAAKTWMPGTGKRSDAVLERPWQGMREQSLNPMPQKMRDAKGQLRREALARRDALPAQSRQLAAEAIAARAFPLIIAPGTIVSGFMPLKSEINPLPLMRRLVDAGARLALPVVARRGKPLIMRSWQWAEPLVPGVWGIPEPGPAAPEVQPDILLVPLLAFARSGHRIGYGAGYYDLTITQLRAKKPVVAIGIAFAAQEIETVPRTAFDAKLDLVLTENETIDLRNA